MKLIMENWRAFLQEEESPDLTELSDDERRLLDAILARVREEGAIEENRSQRRRRALKRNKAAYTKKIKGERKEIELEYWKTHVEELANEASRPKQSGAWLTILDVYKALDCQSQDQCALWNLPVDGIESFDSLNLRPFVVQNLDKYFKNWHEQNKHNWEGDIDKIRFRRATVKAQTKDVSELPGLGALKNNPLYKSLSKKLCPDSMSGGISLTCLARFGFQVADLLPGE